MGLSAQGRQAKEKMSRQTVDSYRGTLASGGGRRGWSGSIRARSSGRACLRGFHDGTPCTRRNVDGVCPSRVARLTLLMCTLSMSACGRGMLHPSHLCQTGVGGSGGSVHETAGIEDDSRRSSCEVCWTRRCVAGSLWKVTLHFHRKLMQSFFWRGLISLCSYSFWRRSNYFLNS